LGTAYASQYIPGAPSEENISKGTQAIKEFQEVLKVDPNNLTAIDHIGSILFLMAGTPFSPEKFEESKSYHERHIRLKRDDPEPYYWVAVIDWTLAYRANVDIRLSYNKANPRKQIKDEDPLPPKYREEYTAKYQAMVEEGIQELNTAIKLRPDYEDAMAYLNFLYRRKADMVESAEERASLIKQADDLLDKVKEIKQQKANQPQKS
jgi:tetratricopeptide (TPR) repeat protein